MGAFCLEGRSEKKKTGGREKSGSNSIYTPDSDLQVHCCYCFLIPDGERINNS